MMPSPSPPEWSYLWPTTAFYNLKPLFIQLHSSPFLNSQLKTSPWGCPMRPGPQVHPCLAHATLPALCTEVGAYFLPLWDKAPASPVGSLHGSPGEPFSTWHLSQFPIAVLGFVPLAEDLLEVKGLMISFTWISIINSAVQCMVGALGEICDWLNEWS